MPLRYKLTDENMQTFGGCQWAIGEKKVTSGEGELCDEGWLHCYTHPLLAMMLTPIHANFKSPRLFECKVGGQHKTDHGLKEGWTEMMLTRGLPLPTVSTEQRVAFGIRCALEVYDEPAFVKWANAWLSGKDRSSGAASTARWAAAARSAWAAAEAARTARAAWAAWAAEAAAEAAAAPQKSIDLIAIAERVMKEIE
jgi:hypothetical protein